MSIVNDLTAGSNTKSGHLQLRRPLQRCVDLRNVMQEGQLGKDVSVDSVMQREH